MGTRTSANAEWVHPTRLLAVGQDVVVAKTYRLGPTRRAINVAMTAMLRHGIGGKSSVLLTTIGRRSGEERTTPVILVENDSGRWLVSPYGSVGWVHNVRASHQVLLRRGSAVERMLADEVGPVEAGPILQQYVRNVRVTAPFFDAKAEDPVESFVKEAHRHPVFKLSVNPQG